MFNYFFSNFFHYIKILVLKMKRVYGCIRSDDESSKLFEYRKPSACHLRQSNILKVDLRNLSPQVQDQLDIGSCVSHGVLYTHQMLYPDSKDKTELGSRLYNYYNGRKREGRAHMDQGMSIISGIISLLEYGSVQENMWPYDTTKRDIQPPSEIYNMAIKSKLKATQIPQNIYNIKNSLIECLPVLCGILIYPSFETDLVAKSGIVPYPNKLNENPVGRHCVVIVGFDDMSQKFLLRNSWGPQWGDNGYFWVDYKYILDEDLCSDLYCIELDSTSPV